MKYRVLREGLSQKEEGMIVERKIGELIEVSPEAAPGLVETGFIESSSRRTPVEEEEAPAKKPRRR